VELRVLEAGVARRFEEIDLLLISLVAGLELRVLEVPHGEAGKGPPVAALRLDAEPFRGVVLLEQLNPDFLRAAGDDDPIGLVRDLLKGLSVLLRKPRSPIRFRDVHRSPPITALIAKTSGCV
jgi:hypothetical protein